MLYHVYLAARHHSDITVEGEGADSEIEAVKRFLPFLGSGNNDPDRRDLVILRPENEPVLKAYSVEYKDGKVVDIYLSLTREWTPPRTFTGSNPYAPVSNRGECDGRCHCPCHR